MEVGKLYQINKYSWLLYPSKDNAAAVVFLASQSPNPYTIDAIRPDLAVEAAEYWSRRFSCNVSYVEQGSLFALVERTSLFALLEQDGKYYKILTTNGELGWIIVPKNKSWIKGCIEEVKAE